MAMSRIHPSMSWHPNEQSAGEPTPNSGDTRWSAAVEDGGQEMWASRQWHRNFFLPLHYEPNYDYPLVVWLHSDGFNENQVDHVMPHISVRNYVAAGIRGVRSADSAGHRFDWHDSPAAVHAAHEAVIQSIDEASQRFSVHASRIVLAGYGSGGTMAMTIAMRDPRRFAAVVSLGGTMPVGRRVWSDLSNLRERRLSMLWLWATESLQFDPQRLKEDIRLAMMIKARVEVRQYPTNDEMDTVVLSDVNQWIMQQVVSNDSASHSDHWATSPTAYSAN